ncbi:hypothetical protein FSP39_012744 [Pinctada imbricata]|uniref:Uncharacterized protein n=1 Tax=Pinctada imbricata TaxID=66713 RepID=A0AA89C1C1_PINIB|nr:hypothetical protein FSP39_012744 [Pinctada imbricata]
MLMRANARKRLGSIQTQLIKLTPFFAVYNQCQWKASAEMVTLLFCLSFPLLPSERRKDRIANDSLLPLTPSKKRPRSPTAEDCEECHPISKRINRLHIENGLQTNQASLSCLGSPQEELNVQCRNMRIRSNSMDQQCIQAGPSVGGNNNPDNTNCMACTAGQGNPYYQELMEGYKPELTERENPNYYQANKLLFNAHADIIKRHRDRLSNT